jgi:hypothetical protein
VIKPTSGQRARLGQGSDIACEKAFGDQRFDGNQQVQCSAMIPAVSRLAHKDWKSASGGWEAQCLGCRRLTPPKIGEMRVPNTGITPGNRNHAVEFGLPVADQNHADSFIVLREARQKAQGLRAAGGRAQDGVAQACA